MVGRWDFFLFSMRTFWNLIRKKFDHDKKMEDCLIYRLVPHLRLFKVSDQSWDDLGRSYGSVLFGKFVVSVYNF